MSSSKMQDLMPPRGPTQADKRHPQTVLSQRCMLPVPSAALLRGPPSRSSHHKVGSLRRTVRLSGRAGNQPCVRTVNVQRAGASACPSSEGAVVAQVAPITRGIGKPGAHEEGDAPQAAQQHGLQKAALPTACKRGTAQQYSAASCSRATLHCCGAAVGQQHISRCGGPRQNGRAATTEYSY